MINGSGKEHKYLDDYGKFCADRIKDQNLDSKT